MTNTNAILLPLKVKPNFYDICLEPNFSDFTFRGEENISVDILDQTNSITLNSIEIEILAASIDTAEGSYGSKEISYDTEKETVTLSFEREIAQCAATLNLRFTGELNEKLRGFYRSRYLDNNGQEKYLATTQFESTDARRAFPCWDEPSLKATFKVSLLIPKDMSAISNMPEEKVTVLDDKKQKEVVFQQTPLMSTYLLAFIIGDLASIEKEGDNGTLMRVWTTTGQEGQGQFALDTSLRLLKYYNDYFGIPYPLPKMDHIAIPDFAAGAMENWGAITYREPALLVDEKNTSAGTRQTVASIIAHEMAHMWFGDLVTMAWWNDLWLNESFASWMGDKATDNLFPEWDVWTQFVSGDTNRALSLDGLKNSHPIEQEVKNPSEIGQLFDAISYSKGASVLRMLENYLGERTFQNGLQKYLSDHQYGNAERIDLWNALGSASGEPVADIMDSWVLQTGYPVIEVSLAGSGTSDNPKITLSQRRFLYDSILGTDADMTTIWKVPIGVKTAGSYSSLLLTENSLSDASPDSTSGWIKVNPDQAGFYRVKYQEDALDSLIQPIKDKELSPSDRLGLQNDAYALSKAGMIPITDFLNVVEAYREEDNAPVCSDLSSNLNGLDTLIYSEIFYDTYKQFCVHLFSDIGKRIGWEAKTSEGHLDALLRSTVLNHLGYYGDESILKEAAALFQAYSKDTSSLAPDLRGIVLNLAALSGDRSTYDDMWKLRNEAALQEEKSRILYGLTSFTQPELLEETLNRSLTDEIRMHETVSLITLVSSNNVGRKLAWQFVKDNWSELDKRYGEGGFALMRLVGITSQFTGLEMREDVDRFFTDHPTPGAERTISQSLERISLNNAWLKANSQEMDGWLSQKMLL